MDVITFTSTSSYEDKNGAIRTESTTKTITGKDLTHMAVTNVYVDFLRGAGYVLNKLSTDRFD